MRTLSRDIINEKNKTGITSSCSIYKIDSETAVKIYNYKAPIEVIEQEKTNARNSMLLGIPTLISFDIVQIGDDYGVIYENLESDTLGELIMKNPDKFEYYTSGFTALAHEIHSTKADTGKFNSIKDLYTSYLKEIEARTLFTSDEIAACIRLIKAIPDSNRYLHMDLQPRPIRYSGGEMVISEMRDVAYGHPIFDLGSTALSVYMVTLSGNEAMTRLTTNMDCLTSQKFWITFIRDYFNCTSDEDTAAMARRSFFLAWLKYMIVPVIFPPLDENIIRSMQEGCRRNFLPHIDEWIADMKDVWKRFE